MDNDNPVAGTITPDTPVEEPKTQPVMAIVGTVQLLTSISNHLTNLSVAISTLNNEVQGVITGLSEAMIASTDNNNDGETNDDDQG